MSSRPARVPGEQYILKKTSLSTNFKRKPKKCKYTIKKIKPTMYQAKATEKWQGSDEGNGAHADRKWAFSGNSNRSSKGRLKHKDCYKLRPAWPTEWDLEQRKRKKKNEETCIWSSNATTRFQEREVFLGARKGPVWLRHSEQEKQGSGRRQVRQVGPCGFLYVWSPWCWWLWADWYDL